MINNNDTNFIAIKNLTINKEFIVFDVGIDGMIKLYNMRVYFNDKSLSHLIYYDISDQLAALIIDKALKIYEEQKGKENV